MRVCSFATFVWFLTSSANGFAPLLHNRASVASLFFVEPKTSIVLRAVGNEEEEKKENPYADPNYPDLEFVNYDDPEYQVDQGVGDEFSDPDSTEAQIEAMREERRMRNDEFQFETYFKEVLKEGEEYKGEWIVFHTSTFMDGEEDAPGAIPRLKKAAKPLKVITKGERVEIESGPSEFRLQNERIMHDQRVFTESNEEKSPEQLKQEDIIMSTQFWPSQLSSMDFRGEQGIMCCGNGYTICTGVQLNVDTEGPAHEGPFSEYRAELGIQSDALRFRVKLDYAVKEEDKKTMEMPPLQLRSMTVCRETLGMWPRADSYKSAIEALTEAAFFGPAGAPGGLYDAPPVGSEEQASQYMLLDLEGGATILLPYLMDQDPSVHPDSGWVTSLDWTPGEFRFQIDRKIYGGKGILGLRSLELSEVQSADAATYRPRDGGSDMRQ
jgi:hypothetical protein